LNLPAGAVSAARAQYDLPIVTDTIPGRAGPLAGIVAALEWAQGLEDVAWLASFPCDTPFLPATLVEALRKAATKDVPVFAHDGERAQHLCALWPLTCLETLREGVESGRLRSLYRAHEELGAIACPIAAPAHAFFNVNTPADLKQAERLAQR
jgi:molybdopterin-guanine dinucleotide biosynthesis protein A